MEATTEKNTWPYVKLSPELMQALEREAMRRELVPRMVDKGQNRFRVGVANLIRELLNESED